MGCRASTTAAAASPLSKNPHHQQSKTEQLKSSAAAGDGHEFDEVGSVIGGDVIHNWAQIPSHIRISGSVEMLQGNRLAELDMSCAEQAQAFDPSRKNVIFLFGLTQH